MIQYQLRTHTILAIMFCNILSCVHYFMEPMKFSSPPPIKSRYADTRTWLSNLLVSVTHGKNVIHYILHLIMANQDRNTQYINTANEVEVILILLLLYTGQAGQINSNVIWLVLWYLSNVYYNFCWMWLNIKFIWQCDILHWKGSMRPGNYIHQIGSLALEREVLNVIKECQIKRAVWIKMEECQ